MTDLGIERVVLSFPHSAPEANPIDIYRAFIANKLAPITGVGAEAIFESLQWTQSLDHGDLNLPVPRLRVKRAPPAILAKEWAQKVGCTLSTPVFHAV
jgi:arginyl-tRNA synthetase